jgi:hypothetical protein|nr:MAG TPA: hypothetical protein [Caudoviricetes sp.]
MKTILNRIAIWLPKPIDELTVNITPAGLIYYKDDIAKTSDRITYRYAKNFSVEKDRSLLKFCLFFTTFSDDKEAAEFTLDLIASTLTYDYVSNFLNNNITGEFKYLKHYFTEDK